MLCSLSAIFKARPRRENKKIRREPPLLAGMRCAGRLAGPKLNPFFLFRAQRLSHGRVATLLASGCCSVLRRGRRGSSHCPKLTNPQNGWCYRGSLERSPYLALQRVPTRQAGEPIRRWKSREFREIHQGFLKIPRKFFILKCPKNKNPRGPPLFGHLFLATSGDSGRRTLKIAEFFRYRAFARIQIRGRPPVESDRESPGDGADRPP